jgi:hypothetical protein
MKCHGGTRAWADYQDKPPKLRKMDMRFDMWNAKSLHKAGSLMTVEKELSKYVRFSGSTGGQMGHRWYRTSRRICIFLWKGE